MSVKGIHWAQNMRGVCPYRKALLYALGERHHKDQNIVVADQVMLADDAGMSSRTVRKYLRLLEQDGLVFPRVVGLPGGGRVSNYTLAFGRTRPLSAGPVRKDVPDLEKEKLAGSKRKTSPDQKPDRNGKHVPDQSGSCVPFPQDTKKHEVSLSNERDGKQRRKPKTFLPDDWQPEDHHAPLAQSLKFTRQQYELARDNFRDYWTDKGRHKSAKKSDWPRAFTNWLNNQAVYWKTERQKPAPWLEKAVSGTDWPAALRKWLETGAWAEALGPKPTEPDYRGPLEPLRPLIAGRDPKHPVISQLIAKLETPESKQKADLFS